MWDRPEELVGRADVDKHIQEPPHKRGMEDSKKTGADKHVCSPCDYDFDCLIIMNDEI